MVSVDGLRLDRFEPGHLYNVGTELGCLLLCEGWAEPADDTGPAELSTRTSQDRGAGPPDFLKEMFPYSIEAFAPRALAADKRRRRR